ncbi:Integral membrane protein [Venustampulla echinocandica]|uniref:Integral membrane protein n=1 Tax=Venustampulla echinocandica TaxID=2656787 RepID=A0A370TK71_9HELO|nr:Integral membrane protein [Venustampulla echinocandica]RDL35907.1 Integral membrane protein [Venustampulla echinocandica]
MQDDRRSIPDATPTSSSHGPETGPRLDSISQGSRTPGDGGGYTRRPSIGIRRLPSLQVIPSNTQPPTQSNTQAPQPDTAEDGDRIRPVVEASGRRRSHSAPQPIGLNPSCYDAATTTSRISTKLGHMPDVAEETTSPTIGSPRQALPIPTLENVPTAHNDTPTSAFGRLRARTNIGSGNSRPSRAILDGYEDGLVDFLDTVGMWNPEVATLSTLTNVQNSLFVPDLGGLLNRRPTYNLTRRPSETDEVPGKAKRTEEPPQERPSMLDQTYTAGTLDTISSNVNDRYYAVLPHGVSLPGWTEEEKLELNDHVRHMLHSRRSKFKRSMKGFKQYVSKPLGFFITLYATLITLFGLAWVLFLIGWINVGGKKDYVINVIDNVLVALFAIMGDGLAPFRAVDTYHMCFIAHYHHLTWRLRREKALPKLPDRNDLPSVQPDDIELGSKDGNYQEVSVLNPQQQKKLAHHQEKFAKSHSFYKPHETSTHFAFPLRLLVAIVVLLDCHSLLQIALGTCTWAISYHVRPFALTTVILCCSITVNITAGVLISVGDHKTRKKDVLEKMRRQELTMEAMKKVEKQREKDVYKTDSDRTLEPATSTEMNSASQLMLDTTPEIRTTDPGLGRSG